MKILARVHAYPPTHNAGAEWMLHSMLTFLKSKGHEVRVITRTPDNYQFQGIDVFPIHHRENKRLYDWCDCCLSHLNDEGDSVNNMRRRLKHHIHICHNSNDYRGIFTGYDVGISTLFNSEWLKEFHQKEHKYNYNNYVLFPPVSCNEYKTETTKEFVTLVNLWPAKGGNVFHEVAKRLPNVKFLGVKGGYGEQITDTILSNITYIDNTPNIVKEVYSRSKIVLMPSKYESWGRVAIEAMSSGIPVVVSGTPGLKESCGEAGIFIEQWDDVNAWETAIVNLIADNKYYKKQSLKCFHRANELTDITKKQLQGFEIWLEETLKRPINMRNQRKPVEQKYEYKMDAERSKDNIEVVKVLTAFKHGGKARRVGDIFEMEKNKAFWFANTCKWVEIIPQGHEHLITK